MKVTVIGYWGAYPAGGSATSSYLIEKDNFSLLVDCGSGTMSRLQAYKAFMELDAVLLSHYHHDHIADIGALQYGFLVQRYITNNEKILPIYGHSDTPEEFEKLTHRYTKGIAYDPAQELPVGPFRVSFLKTNHPVPCYAMKLTDGDSTLVYTADTSYKEELVPFCKDVDLLISECSFYEGQDGTDAGHMNSQEVGQLANKANVKQLVLTHLPHYGDIEQLVQEASNYYSGKITLATEGLTWQKRL